MGHRRGQPIVANSMGITAVDMPVMPRSLPSLLLLFVFLITGAVHAAPADDAGGTLVWRGDLATSRGFMQDLAKAWSRHTDYNIELQPFSTISGIDETLAGRADMAGTARPAFPKRSSESGLEFTPVAWDALVMIVHPDNPVHNISLGDLRDIYYGDIKNWSKLGGPDKPIHLYSVASPLDGIEYSLRKYLFGRGNQPVASPRLYINTEQLEAGVALDPTGLGASTMSAVRDNNDLRMLSVQGVKPTRASLADGSYPLYVALYLATSNSNPDAAVVDKFLAFLQSSKAKKIMLKQDILPYHAAPGLALGHAAHLIDVLALSHDPVNIPRALPDATYSVRSGIVSRSELTIEAARERMRAARKKEDKKDET